MDWIKKHVDTVIVLGGILTAVLWMNHQIYSLEQKFSNEISSVKTDLQIIKTVLIMKGIMPQELAAQEEN